jgi:hypothetical protein
VVHARNYDEVGGQGGERLWVRGWDGVGGLATTTRRVWAWAGIAGVSLQAHANAGPATYPAHALSFARRSRSCQPPTRRASGTSAAACWTRRGRCSAPMRSWRRRRRQQLRVSGQGLCGAGGAVAAAGAAAAVVAAAVSDTSYRLTPPSFLPPRPQSRCTSAGGWGRTAARSAPRRARCSRPAAAAACSSAPPTARAASPRTAARCTTAPPAPPVAAALDGSGGRRRARCGAAQGWGGGLPAPCLGLCRPPPISPAPPPPPGHHRSPPQTPIPCPHPPPGG